MFSDCPRCESAKLSSTGTCPNCNYTLRVSCKECNAYNAPYAKFCGNCGKGTSLITTISHWINTNISFMLKMKAKKLIAGFAFGALLALFAFGSMGMNSRTTNFQHSTQIPSGLTSHCFLSNQTLTEIEKWQHTHIQSNYTSLNNLITLSDIILKNMAPTLSTKSHKVSHDSKTYLQLVKNSKLMMHASINKGTASNFLFLLVSDLLNLSYRDFSGTRSFTDIPKFHYLNIPVEALEVLGINICRNSNELGISDKLTIREACRLAKSIVVASETKIKLCMFNTLPPRS